MLSMFKENLKKTFGKIDLFWRRYDIQHNETQPEGLIYDTQDTRQLA
jgi:hypothetical protein